jgi:hypothetical protein
MFLPNQPSSGVQVVVMKESSARCNALLLFFSYKYLGLYVMWVYRLFYLRVLEQLLCTCLPYAFVGLWPVAVLNVSVGMEVCCMAVCHFERIYYSRAPI